jgi:hypothetical protein
MISVLEASEQKTYFLLFPHWFSASLWYIPYKNAKKAKIGST